MTLVNSQKWQEEHLLSLLVHQLHERRMIPADGQCYSLAPHPRLSGRIDINHAMVMEIDAWQAVCAAAAALKTGTKITAFRVR
jgi:hypothetical protein